MEHAKKHLLTSFFMMFISSVFAYRERYIPDEDYPNGNGGGSNSAILYLLLFAAIIFIIYILFLRTKEAYIKVKKQFEKTEEQKQQIKQRKAVFQQRTQNVIYILLILFALTCVINWIRMAVS